MHSVLLESGYMSIFLLPLPLLTCWGCVVLMGSHLTLLFLFFMLSHLSANHRTYSVTSQASFPNGVSVFSFHLVPIVLPIYDFLLSLFFKVKTSPVRISPIAYFFLPVHLPSLDTVALSKGNWLCTMHMSIPFPRALPSPSWGLPHFLLRFPHLFWVLLILWLSNCPVSHGLLLNIFSLTNQYQYHLAV